MKVNRYSIILFLLLFPCILTAQLLGGDNCVFAEEMYDPDYPMMKEWAKAGVQGGIPARTLLKEKHRVQPGDNLHFAVQKVKNDGGGVLLMTAGEYDLKETWFIPSGVVIRGVDKEKVVIRVDMHGYHFKTKQPLTAAIRLENVSRAGVEDVTIQYVTPDFEPVDKQHVYEAWDKAVFHERELRDTTLFVEMIFINKSENCWVDNCNILWSGSDAIRIDNSRHITCRKNYIDRSYNKCDGGMGYYNILRSSYILCCYEKVRRLRHFAIHVNSKYCVAIHNDFEVDVNFHSGDDGYNLIENNRIIIPVWHSWHCFQLGAPNMHKPPGKWNIIFNNQTYHKLNGPEYAERNIVYKITDSFDKPSVIKTDLPVPKAGTFYPVKMK